MLQRGADVNAKDSEGEALLNYAARGMCGNCNMRRAKKGIVFVLSLG
jgi:hypothetical protein